MALGLLDRMKELIENDSCVSLPDRNGTVYAEKDEGRIIRTSELRRYVHDPSSSSCGDRIPIHAPSSLPALPSVTLNEWIISFNVSPFFIRPYLAAILCHIHVNNVDDAAELIRFVAKDLGFSVPLVFILNVMTKCEELCRSDLCMSLLTIVDEPHFQPSSALLSPTTAPAFSSGADTAVASSAKFRNHSDGANAGETLSTSSHFSFNAVQKMKTQILNLCLLALSKERQWRKSVDIIRRHERLPRTDFAPTATRHSQTSPTWKKSFGIDLDTNSYNYALISCLKSGEINRMVRCALFFESVFLR